jgi:PIN domain nuclease of toxin-antitoxin system
VILLLDTQLLLWTAGQSEKLPAEALNLFADPNNELYFSAASILEIAIKNNLGRDDFKVQPRRLRRGLLENDWRELAITSEHAVALDQIPPLHKDPFDRLLLAQAIVEGFTLVTSDDLVAKYAGPVRKV